MRKLLIVNNIPISYRNALFLAIGRAASVRNLLEVEVVYLAQKESVRSDVDLRNTDGLKHKILKTLFQIRRVKTTTSDFIVGSVPLGKVYESDMVLFFGYSYYQILMMALCAKFIGIYSVLFCETTAVDKQIGKVSFLIKSIMVRYLFSSFIVPGMASQAYLESMGVNKSTISIAVNASPYIGKPYVRAAPGGRPAKIGLVGRLAEEKRFDFAIQALCENPDLEFHIAGEGPMRNLIEAILPSNRLVMHGHLSAEQLAIFYRDIDVLILPSRSEAWGFVASEAISMGCPVILSDRIGCRFEMAGAAAIFSLDNAEELRRAVSGVLENLAHYSEAAAALGAELTLDNQASAILEHAVSQFAVET